MGWVPTYHQVTPNSWCTLDKKSSQILRLISFSYNGLQQESTNQSIFPKTVSNHEIEESVNLIDSLYGNFLVIQIVTIDIHLALNS